MTDETPTHDETLSDMGLTLSAPERYVPDGGWSIDPTSGRPVLTLRFVLPSEVRGSTSGKSLLLCATGNTAFAIPGKLRPMLGNHEAVRVSANVFLPKPKPAK